MQTPWPCGLPGLAGAVILLPQGRTAKIWTLCDKCVPDTVKGTARVRGDTDLYTLGCGRCLAGCLLDCPGLGRLSVSVNVHASPCLKSVDEACAIFGHAVLGKGMSGKAHGCKHSGHTNACGGRLCLQSLRLYVPSDPAAWPWAQTFHHVGPLQSPRLRTGARRPSPSPPAPLRQRGLPTGGGYVVYAR